MIQLLTGLLELFTCRVFTVWDQGPHTENIYQLIHRQQQANVK